MQKHNISKNERGGRATAKVIFTCLLSVFFLSAIFPTHNTQRILGADPADIDALKKTIEERNAQITELNKEIKVLDTQIQTKTKEAQTLKGAIGTLDATKTKLTKELTVTEQKVGATTLTIEQIAAEIKDKEDRIERGKIALADALRNINQAEDSSLVETILARSNMGDLWNEIETLTRFQVGLREYMSDVEVLKLELAIKQAENENQKKSLLELRGELEDRKKNVELNKNEKAKLLSTTQSQEAAYRKQLEEKKRLADAFQKEISQYESQLSILIDPTSYPTSGKGILSWPLENVYITQNFGNTAFAKAGAYNGSGHNGVDFRATPGTKVLSAAAGTVTGTGDTDLVRGCYSYGKWILVKHGNGLSTLYAHLNLIKVTAGQQVTAGQIIGYSGNTGYSTGPHLHFGVYASQGVRIIKYENSINCKNAIVPVADLRAYLNPLSYF
jgi:murein DD-endopeptidase MepM/ murein hydrolase activator NlpD